MFMTEAHDSPGSRCSPPSASERLLGPYRRQIEIEQSVNVRLARNPVCLNAVRKVKIGWE